jgi:hypothetical protein
MFDEFERIWKGALFTLFKDVSRNFPGGSEEQHEKRYSG